MDGKQKKDRSLWWGLLAFVVIALLIGWLLKDWYLDGQSGINL